MGVPSTAPDSAAAPGRPTPASSGVASVDLDLSLLAGLFLALRLGAAFFLRAGGNVYLGDADVRFYRSMGELSLAGFYPYLDYWWA